MFCLLNGSIYALSIDQRTFSRTPADVTPFKSFLQKKQKRDFIDPNTNIQKIPIQRFLTTSVKLSL